MALGCERARAAGAAGAAELTEPVTKVWVPDHDTTHYDQPLPSRFWPNFGRFWPKSGRSELRIFLLVHLTHS
jgi:hypothetical protein